MSDSSKKTVIAFDVYGTLLSTESIATKLASHFGKEKAQNQYEDFSALTLRSLKHTLAEAGESLKQSEIDDLMKAYDSLSTFPEVGPALVELAKHENITAVVFSNGTRKMVENSVNHSPDLAPHAKVFQHVVVVEKVRKFKPAPEVYYHLAETVGKGKDRKEMGQIWLVSGNPFDVVGARAVGMQACWVDRAGNGWQDSVVEGDLGKPTAIVKGLDEVVDVVAKHAG
ncbi:hypothetical protein LTR28_005936 [Elasticomyces elasticus]|nr:hypothetical protein LTR28_005936 [Elasticomyces elasticus]